MLANSRRVRRLSAKSSQKWRADFTTPPPVFTSRSCEFPHADQVAVRSYAGTLDIDCERIVEGELKVLVL